VDISMTREGDQRAFVLVLHPGEEFLKELSAFTIEHHIKTASFSAIGGFLSFKLGFYNIEKRGYDEIPFHEDHVEVLSLNGEITFQNGVPNVHGHTVVGRSDGTTRGGHLLSGVVDPILIVNVEELAQLRVQGHHGHGHLALIRAS
jgi:predicted DNA-binding protein with PD1-like motif